MKITGLSLLFIFVGFIGLTFGIIFLVQKEKFRRIRKVSSALGATLYLEQESIPAEYALLSDDIIYFWTYSWLFSKDIEGQKYFVAQYIQKTATRAPFRYVAFVGFQNALSEEMRKQKQSQVDEKFGAGQNILVTNNGLYLYFVPPFSVTKESIEKKIFILKEVMEVVL